MWLSKHAEVVSKLEGEDDEEDDVPETIEMVVEGENQRKDVKSNKKPNEDRKLSLLTKERMTKLEDLNSRFTICESQFNSLMETLETTSDHDDRMKIKGALTQLYGDLELQYVEIDSIVVGDLQSGKKEAKARKNLTMQVESTAGVCEKRHKAITFV